MPFICTYFLVWFKSWIISCRWLLGLSFLLYMFTVSLRKCERLLSTHWILRELQWLWLILSRLVMEPSSSYLCILVFSSDSFFKWNPTQAGKISSPADLRYQEDLIFTGRLIEDAGNVKVGRDLHKVVKPSKLCKLKGVFPEEKFLLCHGKKWTDMVLEHDATGEDALRGWLVAAYAANLEKTDHEPSMTVLQEAYDKMNSVFSTFVSKLQAKGWHTDCFLDGTGSRFAW